MISANTLRESLKSGPLSDVYSLVRRAKRQIRHEPIAGPLPTPNLPMSAEALRDLAAALPDQARVFFSLGIQYLKRNSPGDTFKALACFRSAEFLDFESPERIVLYKAMIAASHDEHETALGLITSLTPEELTADENGLLLQIQTRRVPLATTAPETAPAWRSAKEQVEACFSQAKTLLVLDDDTARSATWLPAARYFLSVAEVTGVPPAALAESPAEFELVVASSASWRLLETAGIRCLHWVRLED